MQRQLTAGVALLQRVSPSKKWVFDCGGGNYGMGAFDWCWTVVRAGGWLGRWAYLALSPVPVWMFLEGPSVERVQVIITAIPGPLRHTGVSAQWNQGLFWFDFYQVKYTHRSFVTGVFSKRLGPTEQLVRNFVWFGLTHREPYRLGVFSEHFWDAGTCQLGPWNRVEAIWLGKQRNKQRKS